MPMHLDWPLNTMAYAYQEICKGERPWVALGNFMNEWFCYSVDRREELVKEPLTLPENWERRYKCKRWAVFIAASVEWLCERYEVPCPEWAHDPRYRLKKPWWSGWDATRPEIRKHLLEVTPEPFRRRNVYCSDRVYANKFELDDVVAKIKEIKARKAQQKAAELEEAGKAGTESEPLPELARTES